MASLTVFVSGVTKGAGVSKKSGTPKPYSFANVDYLIPAKNFQNDDNDIRKLGMEVKSITMKDDMNLFAQFSSVDFPCKLELHLDANPENPSQNIVVDFAVV